MGLTAGLIYPGLDADWGTKNNVIVREGDAMALRAIRGAGDAGRIEATGCGREVVRRIHETGADGRNSGRVANGGSNL